MVPQYVLRRFFYTFDPNDSGPVVGEVAHRSRPGVYPSEIEHLQIFERAQRSVFPPDIEPHRRRPQLIEDLICMFAQQ
jgi:hypothetical protein